MRSFWFLLVALVCPVSSVWNKFDFVRPWDGAWGSDGDKSYTKISASGGEWAHRVVAWKQVWLEHDQYG